MINFHITKILTAQWHAHDILLKIRPFVKMLGLDQSRNMVFLTNTTSITTKGIFEIKKIKKKNRAVSHHTDT